MSNDGSAGILEFSVEKPKDLEEVTVASLKEKRGLDLSNARDLGLPGAPLLTEEQAQQLAQVFIPVTGRSNASTYGR